jgi:DEAD/DEAH box helicase domain-containing protein
MIAGYDALDQYFLNNPDDFFNRPCEEAILDPYNEEVLKRHLPCAAAELPIEAREQWTQNQTVRSTLEDLAQNKALAYFEPEERWAPVGLRPHRDVDLRGIGYSYEIFLEGSNRLLGGVSGTRALKEIHEGAVYLHRTRKYLVTSLDLRRRNARVKPERLNYYTRAVSEKDTEILGKPLRRQEYPGFVVQEARLKVTETIVSYEKRRNSGQELLGVVDLDLPPVIFKTIGFWIEVPDVIKRRIEAQNLNFMGGIHAIEHAVISLLPMHVLCDRDDIGGISFTMHDQVCGPAVFIYDGHPGGVGLSKRAFDKILDLIEQTLKLVKVCPCEDGCPSCIHSPKCGSGNKPLDKSACENILKMLLDPSKSKAGRRTSHVPAKPIFPDEAQAVIQTQGALKKNGKSGGQGAPYRKSKGPKTIDHYVVFDLETQRLAQEVGGWGNVKALGLSVGVAYSNKEGFLSFFEQQARDLVDLLKSADLVVGFNHVGFDYKVLSAYTDFNFNGLNNLDMLLDIKRILGHRLSLQHLAETTLNEGKAGDGLDAVRWYREGKLDLVENYCREDVRITRDLYMFGLTRGHLLSKNKKGTVISIPVDWPGPKDADPYNDLTAYP